MVKKNKYDFVTPIFCILCFIITLIIIFIYFPSLPEAVPVHFNFSGEIDKLGSKNSVIILYLSGIMLYVFLVIVSKFPKIWNTGIEVTFENKDRLYRILSDLLNTIEIFVVIVFCYLTIHMMTLEKLSAAFIIIFFAIIILIIGYTIFKIYKIKNY